MNAEPIRIGTRESQLAVWQATRVKELLALRGVPGELVFIKSEGDTDLQTPLYEMGVQGIFTRTLDVALLNNKIDIAVHSMKDVPVVMARGLQQAAVLERASSKDLLVPGSMLQDPSVLEAITLGDAAMLNSIPAAEPSSFNSIAAENPSAAAGAGFHFTIATSSLRRKAQWLNRFPDSQLENLRGNVNTRLRKLAESNWHGAIFAAAGLERIGLRPESAVELDWMLPAPAQGAIMVACRLEDEVTLKKCKPLEHEPTSFCVKAERDFLRTLKGGCTAPVSALCHIDGEDAYFEGQVLSLDGKQKIEVKMHTPVYKSYSLGVDAALDVLDRGADKLMKEIRSHLE
ncbi:MAG: hydroxymethylbilane synthase [Chitinophagaceae bacterium]|nr:MAG: hydroxymethylbilane synthase [Chitinophagaceae bacterium]